MITLNLEHWISKLPALTLFLISLLFITIANSHADTETIVYELQHSDGKHLALSLQKLYPEIHIIQQAGQIIIRADSQNKQALEELLPMLDKPVQAFHLSLSSKPSQAGTETISTNNNPLIHSYKISEQEPLYLEYSQQQQQLTDMYRVYPSIENATTQSKAISLKVSSQGKDKVQVDYSLFILENGKRTQINNTAIITLGHWLHLSGSGEKQSIKQWAASDNDATAVYLLVDRAN